MQWAANAAAIPLLSIVHTAVTGLVARLLGSSVYEVSLGLGPVVTRHTLQGTVFTLRAFPIGASILLEPSDDPAPTSFEPNGRPFSALSGPARMAVYSAGGLVTLGIAMLLLGAPEAVAAFGRGFWQFVAGAVAPLDQGIAYLQVAIELLRGASFSMAAGVIASKMAALNLMPLPPLNGFRIISSLLLGKRQPGWLAWVENVGAMVLFLAFASYGVAAVVLLWSRF